MKNKTTIWLFIVIVFVIPVIVFTATNWYGKQFDRLPVLGPGGHVIADFSFYNQDSVLVTTNDWKDKIVVADFFFTHCPTICPVMTNNLQKLQQRFKGDDRILINSFTVDPERDSVAQLKIYSELRKIDNSNWSLLTGAKKEIYRLARNSFMIVATDGDGGPEDFIHSENLVLIDQQKRIRGYYKGTSDEELEQLIIDIKKLQHEK